MGMVDEGAVQEAEDRRAKDRRSSEEHSKYLKDQLFRQITNIQGDPEKAEKLAGELAERIGSLEENTLRDTLTGAFNRGATGAFLSREMIIAEGRGKDLGLLFIDGDHFKDINDSEPDRHRAGDRTLKSLVKIMREVCGQEAVVGRWGGEEFVVIVPEKNKGKIMELVSKLGIEVQSKLAGDALLSRKEVTISVGATIYNSSEDLSLEDLLKRADVLMYKAKEGGRNRAVVTGKDGRETVIDFSNLQGGVKPL